jgi:hypothetical protein
VAYSPAGDSSVEDRPVEDRPVEDSQAIAELLALGDRHDLEQARAELVSRIYQRSDDYQATAALALVNKALAAVGWPDPYNWKHRRKP